jgi:hypothetical protein
MGVAAEPAVPDLVVMLRSSEGSRNSALIGLAGVGPAARAALPAVLVAANDPSRDVRRFAHRAIEKIDVAARASVTIRERLQPGQPFAQAFGPDFVFELTPEPELGDGRFSGWAIRVRRGDESRNLTDLSVPLDGTARDVYVLARYLEPLRTDVPSQHHVFTFAPEVGQTMTRATVSAVGASERERQLARIAEFGLGYLIVQRYALTKGAGGAQPGFAWMEFEVRLSWPRDYDPTTYTLRR